MTGSTLGRNRDGGRRCCMTDCLRACWVDGIVGVAKSAVVWCSFISVQVYYTHTTRKSLSLWTMLISIYAPIHSCLDDRFGRTITVLLYCLAIISKVSGISSKF